MGGILIPFWKVRHAATTKTAVPWCDLPHDGKRQDFDAKLPGQELQTLLNPRFAVIEVLARDRILAAEEGPPHRALDAVINADFRFLNQVASR